MLQSGVKKACLYVPGDQGICPLLDLHGPFVHPSPVGPQVSKDVLLSDNLLVGLDQFLVADSETEIQRLVSQKEHVRDEVEALTFTFFTNLPVSRPEIAQAHSLSLKMVRI